MQPLLGTFVEIGCESRNQQTQNAVQAAFDTIKRLQHLLSFHARDSDLTRVNQANGRAVKVHFHTSRVMRLARAMTHESGGRFNCTVGGTMVSQTVLPDHGGAESKAIGDASDIVIEGSTIQLKRSIKVTLDGIAKGYIVDCAIAMLKRLGVKSAWINAGGDLRVFGNKVLPVNRRELDRSHTVLGGIQNAAIATSIVSEKYDIDLPGKIVSSDNSPHLGAWTVMAHSAWRADALTKVACLTDASQRDAFIARLGGVMVYPQSL